MTSEYLIDIVGIAIELTVSEIVGIGIWIRPQGLHI